MSYSVGDIIKGTVTSIKPYALFLSFENNVNGLLHISEISDSYVKDIEKFGSKGDQIAVKVLSIDSANGFLRVSLKQVPKEQSFSTHVDSNKPLGNVDEGEFAKLMSLLPKWIKQTKERFEDEENETPIK